MTVGGDDVYEAQHARLLEGLAASIREKGLAHTQVTDIVRHARASRRTFYKHFPDKDACFVELARRLSVVVQGHVRDAIDPDADWETQVGMAIGAYLEILASDPAMTLTFSSASLGPTIVRAQRDGIEEYAVLVQDIVASEAFSRAGIPPISLERAYMLVSGLHQTVVRAVERSEDLMRLAPEFRAVFTAALAGARASATLP
jgi:AcrR family transcriptional regulator